MKLLKQSSPLDYKFNDENSDSSKKDDENKAAEEKGLTPKENGLTPKEKSGGETLPRSDNNLERDKTQWEFTRFKDEAIGLVTTDPDAIQRTRQGEASPLLQESRQTMLYRGEHLKRKPKITLLAVALETVLCLITTTAQGLYLNQNDQTYVMICFANLIISTLAMVAIFSIEYTRIHVVKEELDEDIRYRITYKWKYWIFVSHLLLIFLAASNINMALVANAWDYDASEVVLFTTQIIMIAMVSSHVTTIFRSK